jgi:hypothetical protein
MKPFKLNEINKIKSGFTVPENYFAQIQEQDFSNPSPKLIRLNPLKQKWAWTAAAVLVLGLSLTYFTFSATDSIEIDAQTAENYLLHEADLTSEEYAYYLSETELSTLALTSSNSRK